MKISSIFFWRSEYALLLIYIEKSLSALRVWQNNTKSQALVTIALNQSFLAIGLNEALPLTVYKIHVIKETFINQSMVFTDCSIL